MPAKYDWEALRAEYLKSHDTSVADFCRRKGLPDAQKNSYVAQRTAGWSRMKSTVAEKALEKYSEVVAEDLFKDTKAVRLAQAKAAREIALKAIKFILDESNNIKNIEDARKLLETATKILNTALGITDKAGRDPKLTQINIYDSKFGPLLEDANEEDLSRLLKGLNESERNRTPSLEESADEEARREVVEEAE